MALQLIPIAPHWPDEAPFLIVGDLCSSLPPRTSPDPFQTIRDLVDHQAQDEALWFMAPDAPTAYVQQALRQIHDLIERTQMEATDGRNPPMEW